MFDKPGVFYSKDPKTIFDDNWLLDHSKIANLKQHNLAIIDMSSEHYGVDGLDHVYHALESAGVNFLLLSHEPSDHKKFARMFFYPHWYHWSRQNFIILSTTLNKRNYAWGCLNGTPRPHRIYNYIYSQRQEYYKSSCFSFHYATDDDVSRSDDVILPPDVIEIWNKIKFTLPHRKNINRGARADSVCNLPSLTDSYIHLVTETTVLPKIFVSEKTWKPIAAGQIFLIFGNPGTVSYLRSQGVDVFDDIIDHGYDSNLDWQSRLHQIHQQLRQLIAQDLNELYINTQQRRQSNVEKFFSGAFDQEYQQTIEQCINTLS